MYLSSTMFLKSSHGLWIATIPKCFPSPFSSPIIVHTKNHFISQWLWTRIWGSKLIQKMQRKMNVFRITDLQLKKISLKYQKSLRKNIPPEEVLVAISFTCISVFWFLHYTHVWRGGLLVWSGHIRGTGYFLLSTQWWSCRSVIEFPYLFSSPSFVFDFFPPQIFCNKVNTFPSSTLKELNYEMLCELSFFLSQKV